MKAGGKKIYPSLVKPLLDKIGALILIVLCSPIFVFSFLLLWILNRGEILFRQKRVGKNEEVFTILKFKTMSESSRDEKQKVSKFGILMRAFSLDELPQLFNVLKGEMSLIGPRPLLMEYLDYYSKDEKLRHTILPGITGWAQVNGRNRAGWKNRMKNDIYYVEHLSLLLDLKILILTIVQLFKVGQADFIGGDEETFIEYARRR